MYRKWTVNRGSLNERLLWRLSKSPATHSELLKKFGDDFKRRVWYLLKPHRSYNITAGEWFENEKGGRDRIYTLTRFDISEYAYKKYRPIEQAIEINNHKASSDVRAQRTRQAKLRAKLIKAGKYNEEAEKKICGSM